MLSAHAVLDILQANGFKQLRQSGSHITMRRDELDAFGHIVDTVTVIVPNHREIAIGTLSSIVRQSRLARDLFE